MTRHNIDGYKVDTTYVHPPIPVRKFDWQATFEDYEPGCPMGSGHTEQEAIDDLFNEYYLANKG